MGFSAAVDGVTCVSNGQISLFETTTTFDCQQSGATLRISLPGNERILTLCEVEILASWKGLLGADFEVKARLPVLLLSLQMIS